MSDGVVVAPVTALTADLLTALERLLPQLSTTARLDGSLLRQLLAHDASTLFVARLGGAVVGMTTLVVHPIPTGWRAHVDDVVVDSTGRGRGVGEALLRAALSTAVARGVRSVDLTSRPSREAAVRLYERVGFVRRDTGVFRHDVEAQA